VRDRIARTASRSQSLGNRCRSMWEIQPTCTDTVVDCVFGDCRRGSWLPDCYTPRRVIDGLTPRDRQRGHARVSGQVSDGRGPVIL
jgi:hypothetical protein